MKISSQHPPFRSSFRRPWRCAAALAICATMAISTAHTSATAVVDPNATTTVFDPNSTTTTTTLVPLPTVPVTAPPPTPTPVVTIPPTLPPGTVIPGTIPDPNSTVDPLATSVVPAESTLTSLPSESTSVDPNATTIPLDANGQPITTLDPAANPFNDPALGDASLGDADSEPAPIQQVVVPAAPYGAPLSNLSLKSQLAKLTASQQKLVAEAQARIDVQGAKISAAQEAIDELNARAVASRDKLAETKRLRELISQDMLKRALRQYTGESAVYLRLIIDAKDVNSLRRRADIVGQVQRRDAALVDSYRNVERTLGAEQKAFDDLKAERQSQLDQLVIEQKKLEEEFQTVSGVLKAISSPVLNGFVFPVQLPVSFTDTYGADRMVGTPFFHPHQGVDIFAPEGTPLRAVRRGIVTKIGMARLGGWRLWLIDGDQNYYYYAHLSAYAAGIYNGKPVEAGEIIGFVGHTGNAVGTPNHLHFEIHPGGKGPIDPTPILQAVKDANLEEFVRAMQPTFANGGLTPTTVPAGPPATLPGGALAPTTLPASTVATLPTTTTPILDSNGVAIVVPTSIIVRKTPSVSLATPTATSPKLPAPSITAEPDLPKDASGKPVSTIPQPSTTVAPANKKKTK
jgi:murein DD-endopeptidase MepM/ murein hydrolase activator NlpD